MLAWFLFFICATIGGAVAGFIGGALIGAVLGAFGSSPEIIRAAGAIVGFIVAMPVSYIVFRLVVARLIVAKIEAATAVPEPPPSQPYVPPMQ